jgi:glycosyltransferase involved in cell wall biosynthesis
MDLTVGIIMPVYNGADFLQRSVNSVLKQSYRKFKFIIVDDGSTDSSAKIIQGFDDNRINFYQKLNGGKNSALNFALSFLDCDYITFIDQDDEIHKDHIFALLYKIRQYNADISICEALVTSSENRSLIKSQSDLVFDEKLEYSDLFLDTKNLLYNFFNSEQIKNPLWNKMYKRELFNQIVFPEHFILDDLPVLYRLLNKSSNAIYYDFKSYFHYTRLGSLSRNPNFNSIYTRQINTICIEKFYYFEAVKFENIPKKIILDNVYMIITLNTAKLLLNNISKLQLREEVSFLHQHYGDYFMSSKLSFKTFLKKLLINEVIKSRKANRLILYVYVTFKYYAHDIL